MIFIEEYMGKILLLLIIIFFISCGKNTIEEKDVCLSQSDCLDDYECLFNVKNEKKYGKCIKKESCKTDEDCKGNLICDKNKQCSYVNFKILTSELDVAERGKEYSFEIKVKGLKDGHFYFESLSRLPQGLTLSDIGEVSGIPEVLGEFTFKVRLYSHAKDEKVYFNKNYVEKELKIRVEGDVCKPNPCEEAHKTVCKAGDDNSFTCECDNGYVELDGKCIKDICNNPSNPCNEEHKSVCVPNNDYTDFTCECDEGYYLKDDVCIVDYCIENPCTNEGRTKCVNDDNEAEGYRCECDEGLIEYEGECINDVCSPNPCTDSVKNVCKIDLTVEGNYRCECKNGFYEAENGMCYYDLCKALNNPCASNTSTYKTRCVNDENSYVCECDARYDTDEDGNCYYNPCKINRCREPFKNVCVATGEGEQDFICECNEGYTLTTDNKCYPVGDLCEDAIEALPDIQYSGTTEIMHADYVATCGSYAQSKDVVYKITLEQAKLVTVNLLSAEDDLHHVVVHIKDSCENNSNQMACSDRDGDNLNNAKIDKLYLEAGTYYIFVDGYSVDNNGAYTFSYSLLDPCYQDQDCNDNSLFCDLETHICKENKCLNTNISCNHGECNRLDATCKCNEGYINSDNYTCVPDPCHNADCPENSTCKVSEDLQNYTCECNENFLKTNNGLCVQNPCMPQNSCTLPHKTRCSYNILDDTVETVCSCDNNYIDDGNGNCVASIADTCPGVTIPFGVTLTGDTTDLHNDYYARNSYSNEKAKGNDAVYNFKLNKRSHVKITMDSVGTAWDQFLHLRKHVCEDNSINIDSQIAYSDKYTGHPEVIEEDLEPDTYYVFADGYSTNNKGEFSIIVEVEPLCSTNSDCTGEHQTCNTETGRCECGPGFKFGSDGTCYEKCMQFGEQLFCSNDLYECLDDGLCHKKTNCEPECTEHSHCNTDTLQCDCDEGFVKNENGNCVVDLCLQNSVVCDGPNVSCNGITGICECDEGYQNYIEGQGCSKDENPCTPLAGKCEEPNRNVCIPTGVNDGEFVCECNDGFIENSDGLCIDNPCEPNPCGENTVCRLDENYHSKCYCKDGYTYDNNNVCKEIVGNSCNNPVELTDFNDLNDTINESFANTFDLTCQGTQNEEKVYAFVVENDTNLSVNLQSNDFNNYVLGITKGCLNGNEIGCGQRIDNLSLTPGIYYLYLKTDSEGAYTLHFTVTESMYLVSNKLKDAVLNKSYSEKINIKGGNAPYTIALKEGESLPHGLSLENNKIVGIPTQITSDDNSFKIIVTDSDFVQKEFTLNLAVVDNSIPLAPKKGDLLINEIYYKVTSDANGDGVVDINNDEFVEIVNVSYKVLSLDGLSIWDSLDYSYRHNFEGTLNPGSAIVIFGGGNLSAFDGLTNVKVTVASSGTLSLKNTGDKVRIVDSEGVILENVNYRGSGLEGSINRKPDLTSSPFVNHREINPGLSYSPGKKADGNDF